jgi:hypothetical protein
MLPITHAGRPLLGWAIAHVTLEVMTLATKSHSHCFFGLHVA